MSNDAVYRSLVDIVGQDYASNRPEELFIYSIDSGTEGPRRVDCVAMPATVEQVQKIVLLANRHLVPITPMGANLTLNGLGLPADGGIVLDMKRMDRILELNRPRRYVVIEAGVTQGALGSYLDSQCPDLEHSRPEAPPMATVVGNMVIRGHGNLSLRYGNNSHHINGMQVVLPSGEICTIGGGSVSAWPFCKGPLPDLAGLFCGWNGTTGIITRLSLKLFPRRRILDVVGYSLRNVDLLPDLLYQVTHTDVVDNLFVVGFSSADGLQSRQYVSASITGDLDEEIAYKKALLERIVAGPAGAGGGQVWYRYPVPDIIKGRFVEKPPYVSPALAADFRKGGGYRYCGAILPVDSIPEGWAAGTRIASRLGLTFLPGIQILGYCHSCMFGFVYPFNRAEEDSVEQVRQAMRETNEAVLEMGGIPWKAEVSAQRKIVEKMDPVSHQLISRVRGLLDPNGIMNPGNWPG